MLFKEHPCLTVYRMSAKEYLSKSLRGLRDDDNENKFNIVNPII